MAYHAAALAAMEHDLGWDPRTADVIVGTSAGSIIGSLLRLGVPASDLAALSVGVETRSTPIPVSEAMNEPSAFPAIGYRSFLRAPHPPTPTMLRNWVRRPWRIDPIALVAGLMADGPVDMALAPMAQALGEAWPTAPLWVCSVRRSDLRRVVFGRDAQAPLGQAVLASCAIPGYFTPVEIDRQTFVDGGVRSPTNADVLCREDVDLGLDLVLIVSPMSGPAAHGVDLGSLMRRYAGSRLHGERDRLRRRGVPSIAIEPGREVVDILGSDFMDDTHLSEIVTAAFVDAGEQLQRTAARSVLTGLDIGRSAHRSSPSAA